MGGIGPASGTEVAEFKPFDGVLQILIQLRVGSGGGDRGDEGRMANRPAGCDLPPICLGQDFRFSKSFACWQDPCR
jgi:hypothetical protein